VEWKRLAYSMAIWNISGLFGTFCNLVTIWYIFPRFGLFCLE
jgi:hypothetical protein